MTLTRVDLRGVDRSLFVAAILYLAVCSGCISIVTTVDRPEPVGNKEVLGDGERPAAMLKMSQSKYLKRMPRSDRYDGKSLKKALENTGMFSTVQLLKEEHDGDSHIRFNYGESIDKEKNKGLFVLSYIAAVVTVGTVSWSPTVPYSCELTCALCAERADGATKSYRVSVPFKLITSLNGLSKFYLNRPRGAAMEYLMSRVVADSSFYSKL